MGTAAIVGLSVAGQAGPAGASVPAARLIPGIARPAAAYRPAATDLRFGMRGRAVRALQTRLNALHYYNGKPSGYFGWDTMEAVWAFKEVQTGKRIPPNPDVVTAWVQRRLAHPTLPPVFEPRGGRNRIEVNKNLEVLVVYRYNKPVLISHVSTADATRPDGNGWITPDGTYRAWEFIKGPVADASFGGFMYNPVFFIGTSFAIHGMPNPTSTFSYDGVPLNPASHGCVRIPMDVSRVLHTFIHIGPVHGSRVYVVGPAKLYWP
jgi:hypothetical protein